MRGLISMFGESKLRRRRENSEFSMHGFLEGNLLGGGETKLIWCYWSCLVVGLSWGKAD